MLTRGALLHASSRKRTWVGATRDVMLTLLIGLYATAAGAQQNQPTTYEGFEGRTVFKVDIAASPGTDVNAFRSLIKQKEGEGFSIAAIRDSVAALQKTALFSQVQVKVEPEQAGLHVTFLLQPAFYLGMGFFPGAQDFS